MCISRGGFSQEILISPGGYSRLFPANTSVFSAASRAWIGVFGAERSELVSFSPPLLWLRGFLCHRANRTVEMAVARLGVSFLLFRDEMLNLVFCSGLFKVHRCLLIILPGWNGRRDLVVRSDNRAITKD